jgi:arginyl-tRNA--protein-N-Asp/Glu arginylyltransferase
MSDPQSHLPLPSTECRLVVVQDQLQPCPYLDGVTARMPLRLPVGQVSADVTDQLLAMGYRRSGDFVYRPQCPACGECKPTRVVVDQFRPTSSMRRVLRRGDRELTFRWGDPGIDSRRLELFNEHRLQRGLDGDGEPIDAEAYRSFLVDTCCDTMELSITLRDQLVGVSIVDVGRQSTSAVYTQYDPRVGRYSLGTYAILKQFQWALKTSRKYVYLGMYVAANSHLNYKARFRPQQRLSGGQWTECTDQPA